MGGTMRKMAAGHAFDLNVAAGCAKISKGDERRQDGSTVGN
jgi:hypothetical protein